MSRALSPTERLAAVAHELVHDERGHVGHAPGPSSIYVRKEERRVDSIVAARLLPTTDLAPFVDARSDMEPVTAHVVATEFEVTEDVAQRSLEALVEERRAG